MRRRIAQLLGLGALALLVAAAATPASGARRAAAGAARPCQTPGLVVWLDTNGNGTAGSVYYKLQFTNLSSRSCTLRGYPGVSAVDLAGRQIGSAGTREETGSPRTVVLAPDAGASAVLRIVEAGAITSSACREVTAAGIRVYPPGQRASRVAPFPFQACSRRGAPVLSVRAVGAG